MNLKHIYKNSHAYKVISSDILNNKLHHAYLLVCADSKKANEYAQLMACEVFCEQIGDACFKCLQCTKIINNTHSDIAIFPEKERLTVEESRKIASDIFLAPFESKYKVYIIKNFDNATIQAQNALLKTLEEPSPFAVFILVANSVNNVAITIKSRVKTINEKLLELNEIKQWIKNKKPTLSDEQLQMVAMASSGNLTVANEFLENSNISKILALVYDVLFTMKTTSDVLSYVDQTTRLKKDATILLDQLMIIINNYAIFLSNNDYGRVSSQLKQNFINNAKDYNLEVLEKITFHITQAYKKLSSHCSQNAVFDTLYINILEEKFLNKKRQN